jgi:hypothetical protein
MVRQTMRGREIQPDTPHRWRAGLQNFGKCRAASHTLSCRFWSGRACQPIAMHHGSPLRLGRIRRPCATKMLEILTVPRAGIEPATHGSSDHCSTD